MIAKKVNVDSQGGFLIPFMASEFHKEIKNLEEILKKWLVKSVSEEYILSRKFDFAFRSHAHTHVTKIKKGDNKAKRKKISGISRIRLYGYVLSALKKTSKDKGELEICDPCVYTQRTTLSRMISWVEGRSLTPPTWSSVDKVLSFYHYEPVLPKIRMKLFEKDEKDLEQLKKFKISDALICQFKYPYMKTGSAKDDPWNGFCICNSLNTRLEIIARMMCALDIPLFTGMKSERYLCPKRDDENIYGVNIENYPLNSPFSQNSKI